MGITVPPLFDHDFIHNLMPKVFDDQDLNIIQSPLVDEEKPIFNNPTLKSKSKIFEMRYHHVYDDYNDKFVD